MKNQILDYEIRPVAEYLALGGMLAPIIQNELDGLSDDEPVENCHVLSDAGTGRHVILFYLVDSESPEDHHSKVLWFANMHNWNWEAICFEAGRESANIRWAAEINDAINNIGL